MVKKVRRTINAVWGIAKKARINNLSRELYLLDAIVKAGCLYGVEIWGCKGWEKIVRVRKIFVKMAMGINQNTPGYIWQMEAGRSL